MVYVGTTVSPSNSMEKDELAGAYFRSYAGEEEVIKDWYDMKCAHRG